jgi:hypothetical protein
MGVMRTDRLFHWPDDWLADLLSGESMSEPLRYYKNVTVATTYLLEAMQAFGVNKVGMQLPPGKSLCSIVVGAAGDLLDLPASCAACSWCTAAPALYMATRRSCPSPRSHLLIPTQTMGR